MTPKFRNQLKFYTEEVNESPEMAEAMEERFIEKFNSLDKYDQMTVALTCQVDGFEKAFEELELL